PRPAAWTPSRAAPARRPGDATTFWPGCVSDEMRGGRLLRRAHGAAGRFSRTCAGVPAGLPTCAPPDRAFESVPGACSRAPAVPRGRRPDEGVAPRGVVFHII